MIGRLTNLGTRGLIIIIVIEWILIIGGVCYVANMFVDKLEIKFETIDNRINKLEQIRGE